MIANNDSITICLASCSLVPPSQCGEGEACIWTGDAYACTPTPTLEPGAVCEPGDVCAPDQACTEASLLEACAGESCCADLCDLAQPDTCAPPHVCTAVFEEPAPEGLELLGRCVLP